jgi:hypothetical protein
MLKFYGTSKSRAARSLWALEDLGLKYEHIATEVPKAKGPDNLKVNPNGHTQLRDALDLRNCEIPAARRVASRWRGWFACVAAFTRLPLLKVFQPRSTADSASMPNSLSSATSCTGMLASSSHMRRI